MRLLSNVEGMDTGDDRRDAMNRDIYGYVDAALNAINRYEMGKFKQMIHFQSYFLIHITKISNWNSWSRGFDLYVD